MFEFKSTIYNYEISSPNLSPIKIYLSKNNVKCVLTLPPDFISPHKEINK